MFLNFFIEASSFGFSEVSVLPMRRAISKYGVSNFSNLASAQRFYRSHYGNQMYGVATYDALLQHTLKNSTLRQSFLRSMLPSSILVVTSKYCGQINSPDKFFQIPMKQLPKTGKAFLKAMQTDGNDKELDVYSRKLKFDSRISCVCRLADEELCMIHISVMPDYNWVWSALGYLQTFSCQYFYQTGEWPKINKVVGLSINNEDIDRRGYWCNTLDPYVQHCRRQVGQSKYEFFPFVGGIQLLKYSIECAPVNSFYQEQQDWITFFREGHYMTAADVKRRIKTKAVLQAFDKIRLNTLPDDVRQAYKAQDTEFDRYSDHTGEIRKEGRKEGKQEGKIEIAKKMLKDGLSIEAVVKYTGLTEREVKSLKVRGKK